MIISGNGKVIIGDNFHSGKNIRILTTFHNFDYGIAIPYDSTSVTIGEEAVSRAGSVVCKEVPPLAIAGGCPAVAFKYRNKEHYYELKNAGSFT